MLAGRNLATPISKWPRPTTAPTTPLPTCTTSTVTPPSHLETSPIVDPCGIAPQNFGVIITNNIFIVMEKLLTLATYLNTDMY